MKKFTLITILLLLAILMQYCKKASTTDTTTTTTTTAVPFLAYVNYLLWTPKTVTDTITYTAATKNKVFSCTAVDTAGTHELLLTATQANGGVNDSGFAIGNYSIANSKASFSYKIQSSGVFVAQGTVTSGSIVISAIDSVNKVITGTFSFVTSKNNYDTNGNITSVEKNTISYGEINSVPYIYIKK